MAQYRNFISALVAAGLSAVAAQVVGGHFTPGAWVNVVLALVTAALVFWAPNVPELAPYTKPIVAGLGAGAALLVTLIGAGSIGAVTPSEWVQIGIAILNTAAVTFVKNQVPAPPPAAATPKA